MSAGTPPRAPLCSSGNERSEWTQVMQRLAVAIILLAILAALGTAALRSVRAVRAEGGALVPERRGAAMQKLAYVALVTVIFGVSAGWLSGL
jgi:hypothetical protein